MDTTTQQLSSKEAKAGLRLEYLDGIRALAALYVLVAHALASVPVKIPTDSTSSRVIAKVLGVFIEYSTYAVVVFIVVSGYSLMLPVVRSADGKLRGGLGSYFKRRALRILPPYYVTVAVCLLSTALIPGLQQKTGVFWDPASNPFKPEGLLGNALLVLNWTAMVGPQWNAIVSPQLWSIHIEWQIYFVFALLLLPVWRRWGIVATVVVAHVVSVLPFYYLSDYFYNSSLPFLALFALGMLGACLSFSEEPFERKLRERLPWRGLVPVLGAAFGVYVLVGDETRWVKDSLLSLATICLLTGYARLERGKDGQVAPGRKPFLFRLLTGPVMMSIGIFSYSLYLIHAPIVAIVGVVANELNLSVVGSYVFVSGLGIGLSLAAAYVFYLLVERHFISGQPRIGLGKQKKEEEQAGALLTKRVAGVRVAE